MDEDSDVAEFLGHLKQGLHLVETCHDDGLPPELERSVSEGCFE